MAVKSLEQKRGLIDAQSTLSIRRQCGLLGLNRASFYYEPATETEFNLKLMQLIDKQYMETPFYGVNQMCAWLRREGYAVNAKRVRRLLRLMGLEAICPKPGLSKPAPGHIIYPYLLRGLHINTVNQVWSTDITYIPMHKGFMYLIAVIDWYSRYVLSWELSNAMDTSFCLAAVRQAIEQYGCPQIFNTDQGSQFTSEEFTGLLKDHKIAISMDGKGRATDNVFIERLWRSLKYEYVYPNMPPTSLDLFKGLNGYFQFYNELRPHSSLEHNTPKEIYCKLKQLT